MTSSGIDAQLGYVDEVTFGTYVEPTRFSEFLSEDLKLEIERIESKGIRAGRVMQSRWKSSIQRATGSIELELTPGGSGRLLEACMGAVTTAGAGPYTHTYDGGTLDGQSLTVQIGRPDIGGTVRAFSYTGMKVADWEIACSVGEIPTLTMNMYGAGEATGETLATASYPANDDPFVFTEASLTVAASEVCVKDLSLKGTNGLAIDRHFICAAGATPKEALESELRSIAGSFTADFTDLTQYGYFTAGTENALVLTFTSGADILAITMNVRYDGETPTVSGAELLELPVPFMAISDTSDAAAFTAVLTNADAAA
tara:strand:- start:4150 stop:5091 length:942 start_codon:yes stop_codon:yes gene_type:complete